MARAYIAALSTNPYRVTSVSESSGGIVINSSGDELFQTTTNAETSRDRSDDGVVATNMTPSFGHTVRRALGALVLVCLTSASASGGDSQDPSLPRNAITVLADVQEQIEEGHIKAKGYVKIQVGEIILLADQVELWQDSLWLNANGNVVFQKGDQKIVCKRAEMNLNDGTGTFHNASGVIGQDLYFHADIAVRESDEVYVIERGAFTSCAQPVPHWEFTGGKARIRRDHDVRLHSAFLKVKSVPVLYAPFLIYPIDEKDRSTGFLLPRIGTSSTKGFQVSESFFWAINRSMDATFTLDAYSESGLGGGGEYRYVLSGTSRGDFRTYLFRDEASEQQEYTLAYSLNQDVTGGFRAIGRVDYFSSFDFQQQYQESLDQTSRRSKKASGSISRSWSNTNFRVSFDRNETAFGDEVALRQTLPQVSFRSRSQRLGDSPFLFSFETDSSRFSRTFNEELVDYQRFDLGSTIAYPFTRLSFLTFKTSLTGRYTYYSGQVTDGGDFVDDGTHRRFYEIRLDARGPTLARIFNTPGNFYADRYKHVIEPQLTWSYRSEIDAFDSIPKFDSQDYLPGTNQLAFSLVNRFFAKRDVEGGKRSEAPLEFLTWTLSQRYFFDIDASLYDPQFSTPYYTEDGTPSHYSPITSKVRFHPSPRISATWNLDYDVNFAKLRSMSLSGAFSEPGLGSASVSWSQSVSLSSDVVRNFLRARGTTSLSKNVQSGVELNYDLAERNLHQLGLSLAYKVQCCGFHIEYARYNYQSLRTESALRFQVSLAHLASFGGLLMGNNNN